MNAIRSSGLAAVLGLLCAACGDDSITPISYSDPTGGKLRLIRDPVAFRAWSTERVVLDLVVGSQPLTGYSVGFDLPLDDTKVVLHAFTPGSALSAGASPVAAMGEVPSAGPLAHALVTAQSQKASGTGAITTDTTLLPGTVLYAIELELAPEASSGIVFDGTGAGFVLPSGGMRNRAGMTVVEARDVAIGKLEVRGKP